MPIIAPNVVAKSGIVTRLLNNATTLAADTDSEQGDTDRQTHRQHRSEREDQDDDREAEPDQLRLRRLELGQCPTTDLDRHPVHGGDQVTDRGADVTQFDLVERLVEVHRGESDRARRVDLARPALVVRAEHRHALDRRRPRRRTPSSRPAPPDLPTPCSARNTIEPDCRLAPCCGKNSDITSNPEALSDAGISNTLENDGPTITLPNAPKPTRATSHAISVVRR